jgi:hypothetical protein
MYQKHHNIFSKDEDGNDILLICPINYNEEVCFLCNYLMKESNFLKWKTSVSLADKEYLYYLRYEFDIDGLGNENLLSCFQEMLGDTLLKTSLPNRDFILNNQFGLHGFYHTNPSNFLYSSLSLEIISSLPSPNELLREISQKVKGSYYLCECDFSFGSFVFTGEDKFSKSQIKMIERSISILHTDNYSQHQNDILQGIVTSGITPLRFIEDDIDNIVLKGGVRVKRD